MASFNGAVLAMAPLRGGAFRQLLLANDEAWINNAAARISWHFQAEEAGVVEQVGFRYARSTGTAPTQIISLQGIGPTGNPDGVVKASATFQPESSWTETFQWVSLGAGYSMQRGEYLSLVIEYFSGTVDASHSSFYSVRAQGSGSRFSFPYLIEPGGARSGQYGIYGLKTSAGRAYGTPVANILSDSFNSPSQVGLRFVLDAEYGETFRLAGLRWHGRPQGQANNSYDVILYEASSGSTPVEKQRKRVDADHSGILAAGDPGEIGSGDRLSEIYFDELALPDLLFGTEYFLVIEPGGTTLNTQLTILETNDNSDLSAFPGGSDFYLCSRQSDLVNFSNNNAKRPLIDLIIDDWGRPGIPITGLHIKVNPRYNDNIFIEHADDMIASDAEIEGERHETEVVVIGDAIKSYGGYKTVELFKDPDDDFSPEFLAVPEQEIEKLKLAKWEPVEAGVVRLVFRLRAETGSAHHTDVDQFIRVIRENPAEDEE